MIERSMYLGQYDWGKVERPPTDVRTYVKEIFINIAHVHAEVSKLSLSDEGNFFFFFSFRFSFSHTKIYTGIIMLLLPHFRNIPLIFTSFFARSQCSCCSVLVLL